MSGNGSVKKRPIKKRPEPLPNSVVGRTTFYVGVLILLAGLIYMIANLSKPDSISTARIFVILFGVVLVIISQVVKSQQNKNRR